MAKFEPTPAQRAAIEARNGAVLVSAAAGSGKTAVLVDRLMHRICDPEDPKNIDDFLVITFTEKAAAELRTRITAMISQKLAEQPENAHLQRQLHRCYVAQISTIDGFCSSLCREYAYELDIPADFRILQGKDRDTLLHQVLERVLDRAYETRGEDPNWQMLLEIIATGRDDRRLSGYLLDVYEHAQCHLYPIRWMEQARQGFRCEGAAGAEETVWGQILMDRARADLQRSIDLLSGVCDRIRKESVLCDKYYPWFLADLENLRRTLAAKTWDDFYTGAQIPFQRLRVGGTRFPDPELKEWAKARRDTAKKLAEEALAPFYGPSREVLEDLRLSGMALEGLFSLTEEFSRTFEAEKQRLHLMDFSDLEHGAVRLLLHEDGTPTRIARELSTRYADLMLDEYQDTNEVQDLLFKAVSRDGQNRFMVGDVKQAIYGFRLADPGIFLKKYQTYRDYREAGPGESRRVLLSENFRSRPGILEAANAVFSLCMSPQMGGLRYGPAEMLRPGKAAAELPYPAAELHCLVNGPAEADGRAPEKRRTEAVFTARRIRQLLDEGTPVRDGDSLRPVTPGDIVILLRSVKGVARFYVDALGELGIPCVCETGRSIFDTEEMELMLSLLQVLDNIHRDIPLTAVLLSPLFGISPDQLGVWCKDRTGSCLYETLCARAEDDPKLAQVLSVLTELRQTAETQPLHRLLERIAEVTEYEALLSARPDGAAGLANLRRLYQLAADYEESGRRTLRQFVTYLEGLKEQGVASPVSAAGQAVTVLSVHKSKGLEFPVVFLPDLSKRFNMDDVKSPVLLHGALGAGCNVLDRKNKISYPTIARKVLICRKKEELRSEELRVLYVAMTRAKDLLVMIYCDAGLEAVLEKLARQAVDPLPPETAAEAVSAGDWILLAALLRTEAGELFPYGRPAEPQVRDLPWRICYHDGLPRQTRSPEISPAPGKLPTPVLPELLRPLREPGQSIPSKITATQLKGRHLDEEVSAGTAPRNRSVSFRSSELLRGDRPLTAAERGTAAHLAMQYLDFSRTEDLDQIRGQLERMAERGFLTDKQAAAVDPEKLLRVFEGPLGARIRQADRVIREFKFSVLTDAALWYPEGAGERLMLQGVTDCCLIRNGALTVIDFKTDRFAPGKEGEIGERYRGQLEAYSLALSRIFGLPVTEKLLYFFHTDTLWSL